MPAHMHNDWEIASMSLPNCDQIENRLEGARIQIEQSNEITQCVK